MKTVTQEGTALACCPELKTDPICDVLDLRNHLIFPTTVRSQTGQPVNVEVTIHTRFTRCSGPLALGDLVYSTTLLPGEKVRLAATDRRSRFSFDSESNLSYRSEQISEEQYRMSALRTFMAANSSSDRGNVTDTESGQWDFHGDAHGSIGLFSASGSTNARGSHDGRSTRDWLAEHKAQATMSDNQSVEVTRKAHSLSIGAVSSRTHQAGETEDHFEAATREFSNPNQCHAVTYLFYRINKTETLKFELVSIQRRVIDPVTPVRTLGNPVLQRGEIAVIPQAITATSKLRLATEAIGRQSVLENARLLQPAIGTFGAATRFQSLALDIQAAPLPDDLRQQALAEADEQLFKMELLDPDTREVSPRAQAALGFERQTSLPTAGVIVKGCIDECDVCEPELHQSIQLDLERKQLQNKLLARQIELLDQAQEYRCCPGESKPM